VRNAFVMLHPFARFRNSSFFLLRYWFIVNGRVRDGAGDGIKQAFEHADRGRDLARGKLLDQFMGVLFVCRPCVTPTNILHGRLPWSLTRSLRPVLDFQLLDSGERMIVGDEDRVHGKGVSGNHGVEVSHRLALAF
jgi:hypothetical protein